MAWNEERAIHRINGFMASVPKGEILVEDFRTFIAKRASKQSVLSYAAAQSSLIAIPRNRAITTNGVHVYANLIDFNSVLTDADRETEASHRRALEFLHAHYQACDALIDQFDMQRVDFHGPRLHAVVLEPEGQAHEAERVRTAIGFAAAFREMVERLSRDHPRFQTRVRVGIDSGPAVAIDSGRSGEREPLFIGSPANHAAKLADGEEEGVVLSPRASAAMRDQIRTRADPRVLSEEFERTFLDERFVTAGVDRSGDGRLDRAYESFASSFRNKELDPDKAVFKFHHKEPPLKDLDYKDHPPSNAVRMELASIFADIDGFTAYIDKAIQTAQIGEAVGNLHVIRAELNAVLRSDFGGRKVRYIGDCIHGVIAEGDRLQTNETQTIRKAVEAAAGLRSSFNLCTEMLSGAGELGLAIGIDFGWTPISRLGLRGEESVRVAASRATCVSEAVQRDCDGVETAIGDRAYKASPAVVREAFGSERRISNLDVETASMLFDEMPSPYINSGTAAEPMRAHEPQEERPMRAHCSR